AVRVGKELMNNYPVKLPGEERVFTRKAQYQYGWDWGPRLVTAGVWKDIKLIFSLDEGIFINGISTLEIQGDSSTQSLEFFNYTAKSSKYKITITHKKTGEVFLKEKVTIYPESNITPFTIENPKLWWCNGLGEANLYNVEVSITKGLKHIASKEIQFGIRDVQFVQDTDSTGKSFYFKLNGVPVFTKGANMIPLHSFPSSLKKEDYKNLLLEAKAMNMNMIRVWGGGMYEDDYFYELCDLLGIMVWQDFMFACAMYPTDTINYLNTIKGETLQEARKLKYHPSIVLLCGNNEVAEGWHNWGWQKQYQYTENDSIKLYREYLNWFNSTIPGWLWQQSSRVNYHPSSPTHGWGRKESLLEGDAHYWGVWWGKEPFEIYNEKVPRFMSEYGFQGMPYYNSFKQFIPENELQGTVKEILENPSVKNHQKHPVGYETIDEYMARDYKVPTDFEDYIYVSQLLQARGMQIAIEAHRRNMPYCMGTLFWQLNDCWPVTSWSVLDFYGNRKASYYTVKEKYQQFLISAFIENDSLKIYLVNDLLRSFQNDLAINLYSTNGELLSTTRVNTFTPPQSSSLVFSEPVSSILKDYNVSDVFLHIFYNSDTVRAESYFYFTNPKLLNLPAPSFLVSVAEDAHSLSLTANSFLKDVYVNLQNEELKLEENFFTMLSGTTKIIKIEHPLTQEDLQSLRIKTLNEINLKCK
ncbi:MAG: glycoside hydrolase family 2 protein, partial [Chitinophagales bacterium]